MNCSTASYRTETAVVIVVGVDASRLSQLSITVSHLLAFVAISVADGIKPANIIIMNDNNWTR